ncbi:MAG: glucose-6-phosphate isomerase [Mollicutes bacterium]|mgnify:CR=1 FL=1|nr:glucose-6-phosphate isomerase [Mollicutes bacterium]
MITFDFKTYTKNFISKEEINKYINKKKDIKKYLDNKIDMMGWYNVDKLFDLKLIQNILRTATYIRESCDVFLVIGIGGSYLGAFAFIEALNPYFYNNQKKPAIYFVGTSLSTEYYYDLVNLIKDKDIIVNVISKSGTTLESAIGYDIILKLMKEKYNNEELKKRIIITTDENSGELRKEVNKEGYQSFIIPNNIGGRFSVFSPVGLLPIAVSGFDLENLSKGIKEAYSNLDKAIEYAAIRKIMYDKGKNIEAFVVYEPKLYAFMEWLKQLYGESLGKNDQGLLPISLINTRDLHSLGQYLQEGKKIIFETVINIEKSNNQLYLNKYQKTLDEINNIASLATSKAHLKGNVLNNVITIKKLNERSLGCLMQFFMISCAISGYLEGVNAFDQLGVEEYKKIMHDLL